MHLPFLSSALDLFYPKLCIACEEEPYTAKLPVCITCLIELPLTNMEIHKENLFTERLYGRIPIESATSLFYFSKGGKVQHLIHHAKYSGDGTIACLLGNWMGDILKQSTLFQNMDVIIPVPLHSSKLKSRGFNQSEEFGKGISEILNIDLNQFALKRIRSSVSQTSKNRLERLVNVHDSFELNGKDKLINKHILLVDDVLTTGATMEACAEKLLGIQGVKVSLVTIAIVVD
ncbi:MAG TPA: phosphoribosyltransferase family protein [Saprospiraceae bacterium]|nr:phosphoribosyltransferase family protein [Saprospiraceae bacterium]